MAGIYQLPFNIFGLLDVSMEVADGLAPVLYLDICSHHADNDHDTLEPSYNTV